MDFAVDSVLLLPCPYDSDAGSNAWRTGKGVSAYLESGDGGALGPPFKNVAENCRYLCQRVLLLWRYIYVSEEKGVVLEEDKIRECSRVD
jgi:hypothetical protein